jgi:hypothetical protein
MPTPYQITGAIFALYAFAIAYKGIIDRKIPVHGSWEVKGNTALAWGVFNLGLGACTWAIISAQV